jgi:hypothetical protein
MIHIDIHTCIYNIYIYIYKYAVGDTCPLQSCLDPAQGNWKMPDTDKDAKDLALSIRSQLFAMAVANHEACNSSKVIILSLGVHITDQTFLFLSLGVPVTHPEILVYTHTNMQGIINTLVYTYIHIYIYTYIHSSCDN